MPLDPSIRKVMVIGSGPIVIGQAAEFDYAGAQACKVLKSAGLTVVLVNSNPATIMTDTAMADAIYLEPLTAATVKRIIEKERPDSLLASLGGQTGLTIASQLSREGFLDAMGVRLLGTSAHAIDRAEDRQLFKDTMEKLRQPCIPSHIATVLSEAISSAAQIGYPVIVRPAFTLGGAGGGVAYSEQELIPIVESGLWLSPISQVLIEKYILGYKEIEFEVMRDAKGNVIAVCSMENFDPVGVHTGDSIVCAPALSLSDKEYQMLRSASLDIITELGIEGGCNCQFALNPESMEYFVIEVNPRVSRSSALASKATGYPIAKVSAKIALGYTLDEISNDVTGKTCACFEPALDYVVVKYPKWPFEKFSGVKPTLGTQMKATGEVMSIGRSFEEALMKAVRGAEIKQDSLRMAALSGSDVMASMGETDVLRPFRLFEAFLQGQSVERLHDITHIDEWFLQGIKNLADFERRVECADEVSAELYLEGKRLGYLDKTLAALSSGKPLPMPLQAAYRMVDTCGAEFAAQTPYFYSTFGEQCEARPIDRTARERVVVLGSGPIRIGQGIEFDYSSVHCVWTLKKLGYEVVIINNNPETVSTDFDTADRLYFEPLCEEDVLHILAVERPVGVVVAFGGQTAIKLTKALDEKGYRILGTSAQSIDLAEDREQFDALLERLSIPRPRGHAVMTESQALSAARELGYPVLVRPSYVIGGQNMTIAYSDADVSEYMRMILRQPIENPVLVDKYLMGTELEVDVISDGENVLIPGVMEHIERAGVHSGDSIAMYPPLTLSDQQLKTVVDCSTQLALAMKTRGLVNIQYVLYRSQLYVIEVNPRASRTIPYISKVTGVPMVDVATRVMMGARLTDFDYGTGLYRTPPYYAAKVPVFSFQKLMDANATLGPEMKSTGEVLGVGKAPEEALFKGLTAAGFDLSREDGQHKGALISVNAQDQYEIDALARKFLDLGMTLYATEGTARAIERLGVDVKRVGKLSDGRDALSLLESGQIDCVVYTPGNDKQSVTDFIALHRRCMQLAIPCLTSLDTAAILCDIMHSRYHEHNTELVDIAHLRSARRRLPFAKLEAAGNDYIYCENFTGDISCPESLAITLTDRHRGIGGDGLVLMEKSEVADARMRIFNKDGSEGAMAGNSIRCVAKYLYDKGIVRKSPMTIQTQSGIKTLWVTLRNGEVSSVTVDMGKADLSAETLPTTLPGSRLLNAPLTVADRDWHVPCLSVGNPHCVTFVSRVDDIDLPAIGPQFERFEAFPKRINTEFVRAVDGRTLKMRCWERGNGATLCCGTGACAAAVAACEQGLCQKGEEITVRQPGGDLIVKYTDETVLLTGAARLVFEGVVEY